jgi:hypothetical protein
VPSHHFTATNFSRSHRGCLGNNREHFLDTFAKLRKATYIFVMSVRPSALNNSAVTWRIFMKFAISLFFFENLARKFNFRYNLTRITGSLRVGLCKFMAIFRWILVRVRNVSKKKIVEKIKTHFTFLILSFRCVLNVVYFLLGKSPASVCVISRRFGTLYRFHLHRHLPMKMEPIESSETAATNTHMPGIYPNESILHFMFNNSFFKSCRLWDNVEKYFRAGQATNNNVAHAHCMLGT